MKDFNRHGIGHKFGNMPVESVHNKTRDGSVVQVRLTDGTLASMPKETLDRCNNGGQVFSFSKLPYKTEFELRKEREVKDA